jgi:acetylornithine deacetylase/succinyl-diaminopimelate desuccinylase-like protein
MLSTLVDETGNKVLIDGFYDKIAPLSKEEEVKLRKAAEKFDMQKAAENLGVGRFIADNAFDFMKMSRYGTSMNLDGIWGGNMFAGGSGAILPNKITSKHNFRYVPNMTSADILAKLRKHLDKHGYQDVEIRVIGDMPWAKVSHDTDIARAVMGMYDLFGVAYGDPSNTPSILMAPAWPAYVVRGEGTLNLPVVGGAVGFGGNAHAANEYYVIEGAGKVYGIAGAEKSVAAVIYNYAGLNVPPPKPKTPADAKTASTTGTAK